ncbi:expressed unknown protein [Seminavis robusta]|uniref:Uncharacterized protein n=1 Tax=Seminavis robusta TaxID=568900 RepID=A0A9N8HUU2_9STRA|nr:expressed unknown protein [Seminavis robusta]|eukprot:Sro2162_g317210.1 n/a (378) ;mRNA; f:15741-16874
MMEEEDYYGISKDYSTLSTRELLAELDKRNIRYAPTTSREDLEFLLLEGMQDEHEDQLLVDEESEMAFLMRELASMGIRLPRYASRDELEVLLRRAKQNPERFMATTAKRPKRPRPSMSPTQRRRRRQHVAISRLRRELNELGIPCPPGASPKMMERLLRESEGQFTPDRGPPRRKRDVYPPRRDGPEQPDVDTRKLLWDELNRRGIRFSPTSTRKELESLLHNSQQNHNASARPPPSKRNRENFRVNTDSVPEARAPKEQSANDADNVFEKNADKERNVGVDVGSSKEGSRAHTERLTTRQRRALINFPLPLMSRTEAVKQQLRRKDVLGRDNQLPTRNGRQVLAARGTVLPDQATQGTVCNDLFGPRCMTGANKQ